MVDDPYKVLGVPENATKDEIKKAYRKKAKEYHPDLHPDDPQAAEKMNEINEAYDMLNNPEKYKKEQQKSQQNSYSYGNTYERNSERGSTYGNGWGNYRNEGNGEGYGGFGDFNFDDLFSFRGRTYTPPKAKVEPGDSEEIRQAIDLINIREFARANEILNLILGKDRNARWYYLSSLSNYGMGNHIQAVEQIQKAIQKEPENRLYQNTLQSFQNSGTAYNQDGQEYQKYADGMNKICRSFCVIQMFCMFCRC